MNGSTVMMSVPAGGAASAGGECTVRELVDDATRRLSAAGVSSARLDAEVLLAHVLRTSRTSLHTRPQQIVDERVGAAFEALLRRRSEREPLAYIVGTREFWSLDFEISPDVLIPRPETERLVELTLGCLRGSSPRDDSNPSPSGRGKVRGSDVGRSHLIETLRVTGAPRSNEVASHHFIPSPSPLPEGEGSTSLVEGCRGLSGAPSICELGTGSGCIAVALAREIETASIVAADISPAALAVAQRNAARHGVTDRIELVCSDLFAALQGRCFDVVVSNPPYVSADEIATLEPELRCEPELALNGGADGLDIVRRLLAEAAGYLVPGGWLLIEIGATCADVVADLARGSGFVDVDVVADYAGLPRVLVARAG